MRFDNRLTRMLGVDYPIVQAPMGLIATGSFAAAVSNAGGFGLVGVGTGDIETIRHELAEARRLATRPYGANVALAFLRDPAIIRLIVDEGIRIVTTSAGDPGKYAPVLKQAGITVLHVVPTLAAARKAIEAGVDGLVVEGGEGGGFKGNVQVATMVLVPQIRAHTDLPIVAAGGVVDGHSMAAAFALGADGVQMGTRLVCSAEAGVHQNWKQAIVASAETDTLILNAFGKPTVRVMRTRRTERLEREPSLDLMAELKNAADLYFGGDMEASVALLGQGCGRIADIPPVAEILSRTMDEFVATLRGMGSLAAEAVR
jgi:enoyl-[acyl-carrier protein] reductase II